VLFRRTSVSKGPQFETIKLVVSPEELGPEKDCADEAQKKLYITDSSSRQIISRGGKKERKLGL
jgi:hypothetical protein